MNTEKAIAAIQKRISEINSINTVGEFNSWKKITLVTLLNIYDEYDSRMIGLSSIKAVIANRYGASTPRVDAAKRDALTYLEGLVENLEDFGIPTSKESKGKGKNDNGVNVNVNQHNDQKQVQTTNITFNLELFVDAIKDELKGGQVKELKAILESDEAPEVKKKSFMEKLKSFGSDVASNILANVLTNPQVYEKIGHMF